MSRCEATPSRIPRRPGGQPAPLSSTQRRFWILQRLQPESWRYNIPIALRLRGVLDVRALARALTEIVHRHEILRTTFTLVDDEPVQVIDPNVRVALPRVDVQRVEVSRRDAFVQRLITRQARRPFDLERGPVMRLLLVTREATDHLLLLTMHHAVGDAWGMDLFARELRRLYEAFAEARPSPLAALPIQYADYAAWQRAWLTSDAVTSQLTYWKAQLGDAPELELPASRPAPAVRTHAGATCALQVPRHVTQALLALGRAESATLFMTIVAAFSVVLSRYTGQRDLVIGSPASGRQRAELEGLIGCFLNFLVLRVDLRGRPTFRELLRTVRKTSLEALAHQDVPFDALVDALQPHRDVHRPPLARVMVLVRPEPRRSWRLGGLDVSKQPVDSGTTKFDLTLAIREREGELIGGFSYATELFDRAFMTRLAGHFQRVLASIAAEPDGRIDDISLMSPLERARIASLGRGARAPLMPACVHQLVEDQVRRTPHAVAVVDAQRALTYDELNRRANQVAHRLRAAGVGPERLVGICLERGAGLVVAALGVLKAGGAYVPLDADYPDERLRAMLQHARPVAVLTERAVRHRVPDDSGYAVLELDDRAALDAHPCTDLDLSCHPEQLAYVIFTSGSTGAPKGVMIQQGSAAALLDWARQEFTDDDMRCVLASTSLSFDLSVFEIFAPLIRGGTVRVARSVLDLLQPLGEPAPTLVNTVPSAIAELTRAVDLPSSVRVIALAGEVLPAAVAARAAARAPGLERLFNLYGPTEDTTYSTFAQVMPGEVPDIGRPLANRRAYVIDASGRLASHGVPGDLFLGGVGVARGYWRRPALTAERFVPDPFGDEPGARVYRTGDRARWSAAGTLEFLGRGDHQVKLRGFRIELGEIEAAVREQPGVEQAAAIVHDRGAGHGRLVAYVAGSSSLDAAELRRRLREVLPAYMVPSLVLVLDRLPLTPNGKVDRRALPEPPPASDPAPVAAPTPRTAIAQQVAQIWAEVLQLDVVDWSVNFFEIGGDSLLAMRLLTRLQAVLQVEVPIRALYEEDTLDALAGVIEALVAARQPC